MSTTDEVKRLVHRLQAAAFLHGSYTIKDEDEPQKLKWSVLSDQRCTLLLAEIDSLYTAAAAVQPPVLPLTEREIVDMHDQMFPPVDSFIADKEYANVVRFARAIEAKVRGTGFAPPLTDALIDAALALHVGWNAKEPEHRIAERIDLLRRLAVGYLVKTVGVSGTGSVPPSANLDSVHPAQRSTQGARTEPGDAS